MFVLSFLVRIHATYCVQTSLRLAKLTGKPEYSAWAALALHAQASQSIGEALSCQDNGMYNLPAPPLV